MDPMAAQIYGLALSGQLRAETVALIFGGSEFVPAVATLPSADNFGHEGWVTSPVGVTTVSEDPAQE